MRTVSTCVAVALAASVFGAEPDIDRVRKQFQSSSYSVSWGTAATYDPTAELEIGDGGGHGGTLDWIRFQPRRNRVEVLSVEFDEGWHPYKSEWPPDIAPVTVKHAQMKPEAYLGLLRDLAVVEAATLKPIRGKSWSSSGSFWVYARLTADKKALIDLDWAGYAGSNGEVDYAKPRAVGALAREAIKGLDFKEHSLMDEERGWASAKFNRDWNKFKALDFHWWVQERYIITIGVVGDAAALATLRQVLGRDPKDRCVYFAINAITRLTKKDVRDKPVEEMDVETTRRKVLDALRDGK
jgi:hypothetical protein